MKGGTEMKSSGRILAVAVVFILLGIGLSAHAGGLKASGTKAGCELSAVIGRPVTNTAGIYLGTVKDFVSDHGRISFVILSHGGFLGLGEKLVAIPYGALTFESKDRIFTVNISKESFEAAPAFDRTFLADRSWAADVYRYFGQQPYWTEEEKSMEHPGRAIE
jgi:sporulation protein YlmC with PRC-barrel domain